MDKFSVDYNNLEVGLTPKPQVFRYEEIKHRLKKVAYDIVRFVDGDDLSSLWQIQKTDNGDVIVAKYDDGSVVVEKTASVQSDWTIIPDSNKNLNIFYKETPVTKISLASLGIPTDDTDIVCQCLSEKLTTNSKLLSNLINELPGTRRKELLKQHPELTR